MSKGTHDLTLCVFLLNRITPSASLFSVRPPTSKQAVIHGQNCSKFDYLPTNQRRSNGFPKESFYISVRPCYNIPMWTKTVSFGRGQKGRDTRRASSKP